jgi:hypothetical protein
VLVLAIPANRAPRQNGQNAKSVEQTCRNQIGKEETEGEGRSGAKLQAQRLSDCTVKSR